MVVLVRFQVQLEHLYGHANLVNLDHIIRTLFVRYVLLGSILAMAHLLVYLVLLASILLVHLQVVHLSLIVLFVLLVILDLLLTLEHQVRLVVVFVLQVLIHQVDQQHAHHLVQQVAIHQ